MEEDPMGSGYVLAKYIEPTTELFTVGHGALSSEEFVDLLTSVGTQVVIDVRSAPGSRRHPHFGRARMEQWLSKADIGLSTVDARIGHHWSVHVPHDRL